ncbi:hypothetical protein FSP39_004338 [Pinctada imbricata]|uniref:Uncharacterized protein n=1 Tax=Pinctada imbricata TaxID=66713 RepID=A0AA88XQD0_PINIB|nr:hypothetical protein FSP39_004338 [Pinctada imbricata]
MRFFRRSRHQRRNLSIYQDRHSEVERCNIIPSHIRWNPFFRNQNRHNVFRVGINPFQNCVNNHVPKCLGQVTMSNILEGDRVENFSSECWLQDHLHQFGYMSGALPDLQEHVREELHDSIPSDDNDDDSPAGSDTTTLLDESLNDLLDNHSDEDDDGLPFSLTLMGNISSDISGYREVFEPPPYDQPSEPPPSYEEATAAHERRSSRGSRSSDIAFLW